MEKQRFAVTVTGIVQGVGFRPYVYKLATGLALSGWILNSPAGVELEIEGGQAACAAFLARLKTEAPPASRIDDIRIAALPATGQADFAIRPSQDGQRSTLISPDLAICGDCLRELTDPQDRRFRYPFINCTNCGPRFTIVEGLPYDRPFTTMKAFPLCAPCVSEYNDPLDRRFHAEAVACAACGPALSFLDATEREVAGDPLALAQAALREGRIVAIKGLGGYHLACDAVNEQAVARLRGRKLRWHKPFALMLPDIERVRYYCEVNAAEETLLSGMRRPIVLLRRKQAAQELAAGIAPGQKRLGMMLPYTPLHYLLLEGFDALVMTSANFSDEPIVYADAAALERLNGLADAYLTHNRPIFRRADDSVALFAAGMPRLIRRARGFAPEPLQLTGCAHNILAVGGQEKNTFCLTRGTEAFLSQHIGELNDAATYGEYRSEISYFRAMFQIEPQAVASDLHPDYQSTRYAEQTGLPLIKVQHHHAHLASVLAEHGVKAPVLGLIFDGTGYGLDGHLWGGEVLYGDCARFTRLAHLRYLPLAGGELAVREPWRQALAALADACGADILSHPHWRWPESWQTVVQSIKQGVNAPLSSGMGRLFDAVAALAGLHHTVSYEGQAAIALEQLIDESIDGAYHFDIQMCDESCDGAHHVDIQKEAGGLQKGADGPQKGVIDPRPVIAAAARDVLAGQEAAVVATRFHRALAELCLNVAQHFRAAYHTNSIALSGGCWQNIWLLEAVIAALSREGFQVYTNSSVPPNDGGLAFGQAAVAAAHLRQGC